MKLTPERVEEIAKAVYYKESERRENVTVTPWEALGDGWQRDMRDVVRFVDALFDRGEFDGIERARLLIEDAAFIPIRNYTIDDILTEMIPVASIGNAVVVQECFCHDHAPGYTRDDFEHDAFKFLFDRLEK